MKLNRLETHDRLEHLIEEQSKWIYQGADDCMKKNSLSLALQEKSPYIYIFAHPRTGDDGVSKRMLWQPRLTKPSPEENSYLFRAISKTDLLEICWLIPPKEMWAQYRKGNVTESDIVVWSINQFRFKRKELEQRHPEDLLDSRVRNIYIDVYSEVMPQNEVASSSA
jgi:hypothetical protein